MKTLTRKKPCAKHRRAIAEIAVLDLHMVKMKLCLPEAREGKGWTQAEADDVEKWYKRYLTLCAITDYDIVPTKAIDAMWHQHILDTRAYHTDCQRIFGEYLHHFPYFGLRGERDAENLANAFETSCALFMEHFGESPMQAMKPAGECCGRGKTSAKKASCSGGGTGGGGGCSRNEKPSSCSGGGTGGGGGCSRNFK